jgi:calcium/proton exchanger cax
MAGIPMPSVRSLRWECVAVAVAVAAFVPATVLYALGVQPITQFALAIVAAPPLAFLLSQSTERLEDTLDSNARTRHWAWTATFANVLLGNISEVAFGVAGVLKYLSWSPERQQLDTIVIASMAGAILGNILLVTGSAAFVGGMRRVWQPNGRAAGELKFDQDGAHTQALFILLALACSVFPSLTLPLVAAARIHHHSDDSSSTTAPPLSSPPPPSGEFFSAASHISLGISVLLLMTYVAWLLYHSAAQRELSAAAASAGASATTKTVIESDGTVVVDMKTNMRRPRQQTRSMVGSKRQAHPPSPPDLYDLDDFITANEDYKRAAHNTVRRHRRDDVALIGLPTRSKKRIGAAKASPSDRFNNNNNGEEQSTTCFSSQPCDDEGMWPLWFAVLVMCVAAALLGWLGEVMASNVQPFAEQLGLTGTFVTFTFISIVGNAGEHFTAVRFAWAGNMKNAIDVSMGSALQMVSFVLPLLVLVSLARDSILVLAFSAVETISLLLGGVVAWMIVQDGRTTWIEGWMLVTLYVALVVIFYFVPQ